MDKLEQLKKEMLDARELYETFKTKNSRDLTEGEKINQPQTPNFIGLGNSEIKVFELTKDKLDEMKQLELRMKETHKNYVKYLMEPKK